jgi:hypothetical protein
MVARVQPQTPEGGASLEADHPVYTKDPIVDALVDTVLELAGQIWINRDRQYAVEDLVAQGKTPTQDAIDTYLPSDERRAYLDAERKQFVDDIMQHLQAVTRGDN